MKNLKKRGLSARLQEKDNERQQIGEVLGEKISVQDFQKLVDEERKT